MRRERTIGSLFAGIGGLELGLEWAGFGPTLWQVERDAYAARVLARHWPSAKRYDDVRTVGKHNLQSVDILCGGFPCQDLSFAGKGAGLNGGRSGLWREFARIIGEIRPAYVVVENVAALLGRGLGDVLGDLAALGYDAQWDCIPASAMCAPHRRDRIFIVGYAKSEHRRRRPRKTRSSRHAGGPGFGLANSALSQCIRDCPSIGDESEVSGARGASSLAYTTGARPQRTKRGASGESAQCAINKKQPIIESGLGGTVDGFSRWLDRGWPSRPSEPQKAWEAPRVTDGATDRRARIKALGNAVVPQVGYIVGQMIVAMETAEG